MIFIISQITFPFSEPVAHEIPPGAVTLPSAPFPTAPESKVHSLGGVGLEINSLDWRLGDQQQSWETRIRSKNHPPYVVMGAAA